MTPVKATTEPGERSMPPVTITKVSPTATMPISEVASRIESRLAVVRNGGVVSGEIDRRWRRRRPRSSARSAASRSRRALRDRPVAGAVCSGAVHDGSDRLDVGRSAKAASAMMRSWLKSARATSPASRPVRITRMRSQRPSSSSMSEETMRIAPPPAGEIADEAIDLDLGADIDPARRLVEQEDARPRRQSRAPAPPSAGCRPTGAATAWRMPGVRMRRSRTSPARPAHPSARPRERCAARKACRASTARRCCAREKGRISPSRLAVLRHQRDAGRDRVARVADADVTLAGTRRARAAPGSAP